MPAELRTARLRLRAPVAADAAALFQAYTQDEAVCRYLVWRPHAEVATTESFVASCMNAWSTGQARPYVITASGDDRPIGMLEARPQGSRVDLGYVLARSAWGRGFMPEAAAELTARALALPQVFRVQATCDVEKHASQRLLEKAGSTREARLERWLVHPNVSPEPRPCFMYATVR